MINDRLERHGQVPILRAQIRELRRSANLSIQDNAKLTGYEEIASALNANVLAGLALELGFKAFYMTYFDKPVRGHSLKNLYDKLPQQIQNDIRETYKYLCGTIHRSEIKFYALKTSRDEPELPPQATCPAMDDAINVIALASEIFTQSRYYFEQINGHDWAVVVCPVTQMIALSEVLDCVYDAYIKRNGWG